MFRFLSLLFPPFAYVSEKWLFEMKTLSLVSRLLEQCATCMETHPTDYNQNGRLQDNFAALHSNPVLAGLGVHKGTLQPPGMNIQISNEASLLFHIKIKSCWMVARTLPLSFLPPRWLPSLLFSLFSRHWQPPPLMVRVRRVRNPDSCLRCLS